MARRYTRSLVGAVAGRPAPLSVLNPDLRSIVEHPAALAWLGHASVLLRHGGLTILTDPVFSERIGPRVLGRVLGPARLAGVPLTSDDLPPIDLVLVSHAHFDHLDRPSLEMLALRGRETTVITASGTRRLIPRGFGRVIELPWDERTEIRGVGVRALRPEHWGSRRVVDRRRGYSSYVIGGGVRGEEARGVLFAGDTAMTGAFDALSENERLRWAILGIGSYDPWVHAHATPEQAWEMFVRSGAERLLPIHHSTFELGDEPAGEAMARLVRISGEARGRLIEVQPGHVWTQG